MDRRAGTRACGGVVVAGVEASSAARHAAEKADWTLVGKTQPRGGATMVPSAANAWHVGVNVSLPPRMCLACAAWSIQSRFCPLPEISFDLWPALCRSDHIDDFGDESCAAIRVRQDCCALAGG